MNQKTMKIHKYHQKETFKYCKRGNWLNTNGRKNKLIREEEGCEIKNEISKMRI